MDNHINEYFRCSSEGSSGENFHKVIALHENPLMTWDSVSKLVPNLSKGWYELTHIKEEDRIEFIFDLWLRVLPFRPELHESLTRFFGFLDGIEIFLTQKKVNDSFTANMVYSLKDNSGFFRGAVPATSKDILYLQELNSDKILPSDYLAFLQIHNGFCKATDSTGIMGTQNIAEFYKKFQELLVAQDPRTDDGKPVDPKNLVPFYESFGMPFFQCFWTEWYPQEEIGNVYYSGASKMISTHATCSASTENMAFPTFTDWLMFYLEKVD